MSSGGGSEEKSDKSIVRRLLKKATFFQLLGKGRKSSNQPSKQQPTGENLNASQSAPPSSAPTLVSTPFSEAAKSSEVLPSGQAFLPKPADQDSIEARYQEGDLDSHGDRQGVKYQVGSWIDPEEESNTNLPKPARQGVHQDHPVPDERRRMALREGLSRNSNKGPDDVVGVPQRNSSLSPQELNEAHKLRDGRSDRVFRDRT